jgi:NAD(P)-dependent dehydrogenase (short-subunit alcohol dehydrogenase family)
VRPVEQQTILITGATDGLGRGVATELAGRGATVLVHGRDPDRIERTIAEIREATGSERVRGYRADLASLAQVRSLADEVSEENEQLHGLVNNAGLGTAEPGGGERMESEDGYELRFAVNYLAGFLLTRLLEPMLIRSAPARIVNVSSAGQASIDFDDVMLEHRYDGLQAYCQSKLAQVMFTLDEAERLREHGVTVNCLHPSTYMPTKMVAAAGVRPASTLEDGIRPTVRLIADPDLDLTTGAYFDREHESAAHSQAYDERARQRLWELSEELTGLRNAAG